MQELLYRTMLLVCRVHYPVSLTVLKIKCKENETIHLLQLHGWTWYLEEVGKKNSYPVPVLQSLKWGHIQFSLSMSLHVSFRNTLSAFCFHQGAVPKFGHHILYRLLMPWVRGERLRRILFQLLFFNRKNALGISLLHLMTSYFCLN